MIAIILIIAMLGASGDCTPSTDETLLLFFPDSVVCPEQHMEAPQWLNR
jgi:hypothetical protein